MVIFHSYVSLPEGYGFSSNPCLMTPEGIHQHVNIFHIHIPLRCHPESMYIPIIAPCDTICVKLLQ